MSPNDVIVFDEEYKYAKNYLQAYGKALIRLIDAYTSNLEAILDFAIKDELISNELRKQISEVRSLKSCIKDTTDNAGRKCTAFIDEIDKADKFLY